MSTLLQTLWIFIGLFLTTGATFIQAHVLNPNLNLQPVNISWQVGAVLLTGCVGGKNAGMLSQMIYLFLGLTDYGVFFQGGGVSYLRSPAFGYLLGFVPAGWLTGWLAFAGKGKMTIPRLVVICSLGLIVIHIAGLVYLIGLFIFNFNAEEPFPFGLYLQQYSLSKLLPQFLIVCATAVMAFLLRLILLY